MSQSCCSTQKDHQHHSSTEHHHSDSSSGIQLFVPALISGIILAIGLFLDYLLQPQWWNNTYRLILYLLAYIPVGLPVLKEAFNNIIKGEIFSEFFLMSIATIGAFSIGEYPEGVAVMLFYSVGEAFQDKAVSKAQFNIKALLDQRPDEVTIKNENHTQTMAAKEAKIGHIILLKPGEKLALDGELLSDFGTFNTAALTGESKPDTKRKGEAVLAGMINMNTVTEVIVTTEYKDSKLSKILELVQNATSQKAPTELFIRKFAKIYTPIVVFLAIAIVFLPFLLVNDYHFKTWLYRALIFLVISCPCALVISIPLGYFGGIGAGSRHGILFKGSNYLDLIANIDRVVMDKTGTMTEGVFKVKEVELLPQFDKKKILDLLNCIENQSTHPIATAIRDYVGAINTNVSLQNIEEISGHGLIGSADYSPFIAGNIKLLKKFNIPYPEKLNSLTNTVIAIAWKGQYVGHLTIADQIKEEATKTLAGLKKLNIKTTMLSGDKSAVVEEVAKTIGIDEYYGDLLPEDKVQHVKKYQDQKVSIAFVGDGVNDAPVIAISDVGIAMGGLGSDAAIETANLVIQDDNPYKIPMAIKIGKETQKIVKQNILLAFGVKALVLILGAGGIATMWEAVFADVGVALLAILNAVRIQKMNFNKL